MTTHVHRHQPIHDGLHPLVYRALIGLAVWLVASIWIFFDRGVYVGLTLAMITVFFVVIVGIPLLIWKTWQHNAPANETREPKESFAAWASQNFRHLDRRPERPRRGDADPLADRGGFDRDVCFRPGVLSRRTARRLLERFDLRPTEGPPQEMQRKR